MALRLYAHKRCINAKSLHALESRVQMRVDRNGALGKISTSNWMSSELASNETWRFATYGLPIRFSPPPAS